MDILAKKKDMKTFIQEDLQIAFKQWIATTPESGHYYDLIRKHRVIYLLAQFDEPISLEELVSSFRSVHPDWDKKYLVSFVKKEFNEIEKILNHYYFVSESVNWI